MSTEIIPNGNPRTYVRGTNDKSRKELVYEVPPRAIHRPTVFGWAEYGPTVSQMIHGDSFALTYGDRTLDERYKFKTHTTPYIKLFLEHSNPIEFKRLLPRDIGPKASLRLYVEIVEDSLDEIEREDDDSFKREDDGTFKKTGQKVSGYQLRFSASPIPATGKELEFGSGKITTSTLENSTSELGKKYPIMDFVAPHYGSKGNNYGIKIWAATVNDALALRSDIFNRDNAYPFKMSLVKRTSEFTTSRVVTSVLGEKFDDFWLKPDNIDSVYSKARTVEDVFVENYQQLRPGRGKPKKYGPLGEVHVYQDNIDTVLKLIYEKEKEQEYNSNSLANLDHVEDAFYRVNLFGLQNPNATPYQTVRFAKRENGAIRFTRNTEVYLSGATDGTMTNEEYAALVSQELDEMNDPNSRYQDIVEHPGNYFWDTGFPLEIKYKLGKFISLRKNNIVFASTYIAGERPLTISEESSRHIAIVERMNMYSESEYFSTSVFRGAIISRSCKIISSTYKDRVPTTYEFSNMVCNLASGNAFRSDKLFDRVPNNTFKLTTDVSTPWAPQEVRNKDWTMGAMWPMKLDEETYYFPAARTFYKDDNSVLTSIPAAMIIAEIATVGMMCQRVLSGGTFTKPELISKINKYCRENTSKRFGDLARIDIEVFFTDADNARGYSWGLRFKVYLPMMRTVETLEIEAYRIDDLPENSLAFVA